MKYNRKNRAVISGLLVGVASIFAVASYFDLEFAEINGFVLSTLLFFGGIVLLALCAVVLFKLVGKLFALLRGSAQEEPRDRE
jgi:hypothetical protein